MRKATGLSIFVVASILLGRRFRPAVSGFAYGCRRDDRRQRVVSSVGTRLRRHRPGPRRVALAQMAGCELARDPGSAAGRRIVLRHDCRAKRGDVARIRDDLDRERVDEDADILGFAAANAGAAVSGAFVVNGSPTQTAMADRAGARSQVAQLAFAAVVLVVLLFLTGPLQYLPRCVLASIVFTIAVGMIDIKGLAGIRRESPGEFLWRLFTAAAVPVSGSSRASFSRSRSRLSVTSATATGRTRWCWRRAPAGAGGNPAAAGPQTDAGLIVYRSVPTSSMRTPTISPTRYATLVKARRSNGRLGRQARRPRLFGRPDVRSSLEELTAKGFGPSSAASTLTCGRI